MFFCRGEEMGCERPSSTAFRHRFLAWAPGWNAGVASVVSVKNRCLCGARRQHSNKVGATVCFAVDVFTWLCRRQGDQGREGRASAIHIKG